MGTSKEWGKQVRFGPVTGRAGETIHPYTTRYNSNSLHWPRTEGQNIAPLGQARGRQCAQGLLGDGGGWGGGFQESDLSQQGEEIYSELAK